MTSMIDSAAIPEVKALPRGAGLVRGRRARLFRGGQDARRRETYLKGLLTGCFRLFLEKLETPLSCFQEKSCLFLLHRVLTC